MMAAPHPTPINTSRAVHLPRVPRVSLRWLVLAAIVLLAAFLRFYKLDGQSLWYDEGNSARISERTVQLIVEGAAGDIHPPLYYLILKMWRGAFGASEAGLRSLSAVCGVLTVLLAYLIGRDAFDTRVGLAAALLMALAPFGVYYAQEARMYALLALCAAASTWAVFRVAKRPTGTMLNWPALILYVVATGVGLWTQYAYPFVMVAQGVGVLLFAGADVIHDEPTRRTHALRFVLAYAAASLIAIGTYAPWLPIAIRQITGWGVEKQAFEFGPALLDAYRTLVVGRTLPLEQAALPLVAFGVLMALGLVLPDREHERTGLQRLAVFVLAALPLALLFAFNLYRDAYLKFLLVCVLPMSVLAARGIVSLADWAIYLVTRARRMSPVARAAFHALFATLLLAVVALLLRPSLDNLYNNPAFARDDYRGIQRRISSDARADDAVIFIAPNQWEVYTYYQGDDHNLFPVTYRPASYDDVARQLESISRDHGRLFVLFFAERDADPAGWYEGWLSGNAFKAHDEWVGNIRMAVYGSQRDTPAAATPENVQFGDTITLEAVAARLGDVTVGDVWPLQMLWKTSQKLDRRYKVFVHIGNENAPPVAQNDSEPAAGFRPTDGWIPNETLKDQRGVWINPGITVGTYGVFVGMYDPDTGQRLPVTQDGKAVGDRLKIGEITIKP